ncbi:MAG TPA: ABC transporter ATP-binding protein, partial [Candidatus Dormibacteraeota bacterium]|nr:ABC transporter ATP-binding protein [Candidatus Dormibacteraeota bacterium]
MSADPQPAAGTARGGSLAAVSISAGYDGRAVVRDVSIQVSPGEVVSVVGPNGSGKSTLLKALVGVVQVLSGQILLDGRDVTHWAPDAAARAGVGYVPQVDDVFAPLTVRENLEMGGYLLPVREVPARIDRVLTVFPRLGVMLSRRAGRLSGGERKMLAMGRVLMLEPRVFVLDEPTANLAPALAQSLLRDNVRQLSLTGASVLIVEQRARAVLAVSDRTYVLTGGECHLQGTPAELLASPDFVETFLGGSGGRGAPT